MGLENGTARAEEVTAEMEMRWRAAWRPVLADAEIITVRSGRRARIEVGGAATEVVEVVAHSTVQVRPKQPS